MRFTIEKEQFLKGLTIVSKAIPQKIELPILANVKINLTEKGLELTGSDNNMTIHTVVPYVVGEREVIRNYQYGGVLIGNKIFLEIIRHLEGNEITVELIDGAMLRIDDGKSNFTLNSINADEYPEIDLSPNGAVFEISAELFTSLVDQTAFAASTKENRPILTTVNLNAADGVLTAAATDTARLARKQIEIDPDVRFVANIPAKKLSDIVKSFEGAKVVNIAISDKKALFSFENTIISTRLTNGEYPNIKGIVPKNFNYYLEVNAREFLGAMERVSLLSAEHDGVVKITMSDEGVEMFSRSSSVGTAREKLSMFRFDGDRFDISFRASFVADAIRAIKSEDVTISFIGEMKPFVIRNAKDDSLDMLVTPLRA